MRMILSQTNVVVRLALGLLVFGCFFPLTSEASNHTYFDAGWFEHRAVVLAPDTTCGEGMARISFLVKDFDSMANLANTQGLSMNIQVWNANTFMVVRQTGFQPLTSASSGRSVCYNPMTERVNPTVLATAESPYRSYRGYGWTWMDDSANRREIGYHHQGNIHIMQKTDGAYTSRALYPARQIVNVSPVYRFTIPTLTSLYGATGVDSTITHVVDMMTGTLIRRRDINTRGGAGNYELGNVALTDGYFAWTFTNRMNGQHRITFPGTSSGSNLFLGSRGITVTNNYAPSTGWPAPAPFLVDRVVPAAAASHAITSESETSVAVDLRAVVRDPLAGMATVRFTIEDITARQTPVTGSYTYPFVVGAGVTGGPKDEQQVTVPFTLLPGSTYRYRVTATDAAGNVVTTTAITFTTPGTRPDVVEPPVVEPVDIDVSISVTPTVVRRGDEVYITWEATPPTAITGCTLTGLDAVPTPINPTAPEGGIAVTVTAQRSFTISCTGIDGSVHEDSVTVQILPDIYET